jgi:hypothetical protein
MTKINSSPDRHTFQEQSYIERCKEERKEPSEDYLNMFKSQREQDEERMADPAWQKDNMEYDLRSTKWICDKVKSNKTYAQNLYAAMCNMEFVKTKFGHCSRINAGVPVGAVLAALWPTCAKKVTTLTGTARAYKVSPMQTG